MTATALHPGFADPVFDGQATFRAVLTAMSYPGRLTPLDHAPSPPAPLGAAAGALALTLLDFDTPVWLDPELAIESVATYIRFHCGSPVVPDPAQARFALIADAAAMPPLAAFDIGEDRYPDRSATLIISVPSLTQGPATTWTGPGINGAIRPAIAGLPADLWSQWADNAGLYPQGVDIVFTCGSQILGLPRTIIVEA